MTTPSLIVLAGFMGTGKTAVGQALARTLHYAFIDSDREIEARETRSVQNIFETDGEPHFRKLEKETIARLAQAPQTVLSVGGGAILDPDTFKLLHQQGTVVLLTASVDEIAKRLGHGNERPLLKGGDRKKKIQKIMKDRDAVYSKVGIQIDTTGQAIDQVVQAILKKLPS
ncbi:MAG: shikimate kinase [bacterium]